MTINYLKVALSEYKIGNKAIARQILTEIVANDPRNEQAWLLMLEFAEKKDEKIYAMRQVLAINPHNEAILQALNLLEMGVSPGASQETLPKSSSRVKSRRKAAKDDARPVELTPNVWSSAKESELTDVKIKVSIDVETTTASAETNETQVIAAVMAGPGLAKKNYDIIEAVPAALPAPVVKEAHPVRLTTALKRRGKLFLAGMSLLALVIILWLIFMGLMLARQNLAIFNPGPGNGAAETRPVNTVPAAQPAATLAPTVPAAPSAVSPTFVLSQGGSKDDPVKAGSGRRFDNLGIVGVLSSTWKAGQTGMAVLVVELVCERPTGEICSTELLTFDMVGKSGVTYGRAYDPAISKPWFGRNVSSLTYGGGTERGYVGFLISSPEDGMLLRVQYSMKDRSEVYFELP